MTDLEATPVSISRNPRGGYSLVTSCVIPRPVGEVFGFFTDVTHLERLTPPWLGFKLLTRLPLELRRGSIIEYTIRLYGIPLSWKSEIVGWEPNRRFVDMQIRGPYRTWIHEHTFGSRENGTECTDWIEYDVPGGPLAHVLVARELKRIFHYRRDRLQEIFANPVPALK